MERLENVGLFQSATGRRLTRAALSAIMILLRGGSP
jgi:hypothetical protein